MMHADTLINTATTQFLMKDYCSHTLVRVGYWDVSLFDPVVKPQCYYGYIIPDSISHNGQLSWLQRKNHRAKKSNPNLSGLSASCFVVSFIHSTIMLHDLGLITHRRAGTEVNPDF